MFGRSWRSICAAKIVLGLLYVGMAAAQTPIPIPQQHYQPWPIPLNVSGGALDSLSAPPVYCIGGTLGALVADENGLQYVAGCNHVLDVGPNGNLLIGLEIVQPGLIDSGCIQNTSYAIGTLSAVVPLVLGSTAANKAVGSARVSAANLAQASDLEKATADAEAVRKRHLAELMKIPHVTGVAIASGPYGNTIFQIEVDKPENVPEVERHVPSKLEGYDVDVIPEATGIGA